MLPIWAKPPSAEKMAEFQAALHRYYTEPWENCMMATYGANEFMENPNEIGVRVKGDPVFVSCEPEDDDTQEIDPPVEVGDAAT